MVLNYDFSRFLIEDYLLPDPTLLLGHHTPLFKCWDGQFEQVSVPFKTLSWPRGYKTFFKLSSAEHKISTADEC